PDLLLDYWYGLEWTLSESADLRRHRPGPQRTLERADRPPQAGAGRTTDVGPADRPLRGLRCARGACRPWSAGRGPADRGQHALGHDGLSDRADLELPGQWRDWHPPFAGTTLAVLRLCRRRRPTARYPPLVAAKVLAGP